ncbi:PAS modulated sigma54 specific transcriptional regulator, Fis family [Desulfarculus baarsii DSM 2075]|uniref:PAS modulated sigma54 specific transcriptional regulator, Fis family n=1 Tax=Desulfarculus baarsii (strain ATCC 33931 / DSM 2075 / LMG 7858 / VKM B-1802 / 2st14) TaxID=644282 RepID=E1QF19_DESB2|nr:sigma-54-dependent Fis family transcriptional regulator [Desulfarculus baarsii]ADK84155.1 PAS modulated sigma54 specific transcriptional regulator, Fis family [Desulfarculus baarsii DSM 2075]
MIDSAEKNAPPSLAGDGVLLLDSALMIMGLNMTARHLLGGGVEPGQHFRPERFFRGEGLDEVVGAIGAALGRGESRLGLRAAMTDATGHTFSADCAASPFFERPGRIGGVIFNFRDVDFAPLREGRFEPSERLPEMPRMAYSALVDNLAEGIFTINTRWRITSFNQAAERLTGYRRQEVLGRHCWDIFRSDLCEAGCPLRTTLDSGVTRMDQDVRMLHKEGKRLGILVNTSVIKDAGGTVVGAVETFRPLLEQEQAQDVGDNGPHFTDIIGQSQPMRRLFEMLPDVAASEASVLIQGESGTGKELFARAIHHNSPRRQGPFVAVNCSALAETLLESEMFGHEKAAFTGAVRSRVGRFELARGGTLFLDEIGELKPELQVKLLRVLEQKVFERVGGTRLITMDARIISATNRDLGQALKDGRFREDLFYRLRTVPMTLPPLRRRQGDMPLLVRGFIEKLNVKYNKQVRSVDPKVMKVFNNYAWPGNVRELERVMEHAFVFVRGPVIFPHNLPALDEFAHERLSGPAAADRPPRPGQDGEREAIAEALRKAGGRRGEAAALLGLSRTSLWRRMKALGLA